MVQGLAVPLLWDLPGLRDRTHVSCAADSHSEPPGKPYKILFFSTIFSNLYITFIILKTVILDVLLQSSFQVFSFLLTPRQAKFEKKLCILKKMI